MAVKIRPNSQTLARNNHLPDVARRTIDAVTPIIQAQNHNALQVSSYPVLIYRKLLGGAPCSCSYAHPVHASAPLYDEEGHAASSTMHSIIQQARFGIEEYNPEFPGGPISNQDTVLSGPEETRMLIEPEDEFDMLTEGNLNAYSASACAICFGSGFRGGYSFAQGLRRVFQATDVHTSDLIEIDRSTGPYQLVLLAPEAQVSFRLLVPAPVAGLLPKITVWNNFNPIEFAPQSLTAVHDDPSIGPYEVGPIGFKAAGWVTLTFNASRVMVADQAEVRFTHIEVQMPLTMRPVFADMPTLDYAFDASRLTQLSAQTVVLSPNCPQLFPRDVISDMTYGQHWIVTSAKAIHPASGHIWTQEVQVRPLEPHEPESNLALPENGWVRYYAPNRLTTAQQPRHRRGGN